MTKFLKRMIAGTSVAAIVASIGCGLVFSRREQVTITVGFMSVAARGGKSKREISENEKIKRFEKKYPYINVIPSDYEYNQDSFVALAASKSLPTMFRTWYTEIPKISRAGIAVDLTDYYIEKGYDKKLNPLIKDVVCQNGRYYGIPCDVYSMGLQINMNLFREAGFVDETGNPIVPETYDDFMQMADEIHKKTGKAAFALPLGDKMEDLAWIFMNLAWSYGVEFIREEDGRWYAAFDSPECRQALQLVYDMKWKYGFLFDENVGYQKIKTYFKKDEVAMMITSENGFDVELSNGNAERMNIDDIAKVRLPSGPAGSVSLMGGGVYMISAEATPEQIDACLKWAEFCGYTPEVDKYVEMNWRGSYEVDRYEGIAVGCSSIPIWIDDKRQKVYDEIIEEYRNIDPEKYESYDSYENVELRKEVSIYGQDLYLILGKCILKILESPDCDIDGLMKQANSEFQERFLDKYR